MKVFLTISSTDVTTWKGVARLSSELIKRLKGKIDIEVFEPYKNGKKYLKPFINISLTHEETIKMAIECAPPEDMANKILYLINHSGEYRKISKSR